MQFFELTVSQGMSSRLGVFKSATSVHQPLAPKSRPSQLCGRGQPCGGAAVWAGPVTWAGVSRVGGASLGWGRPVGGASRVGGASGEALSPSFVLLAT